MKVFVAVVDRLGLESNVKHTADLFPSLQDGYEGVAYFLSDCRDIRFYEEDPQQSSSEKSLTFVISSSEKSRKSISTAEKGKRNLQTLTTITLPLANTIFQTGHLATLRQSEWRLSVDPPGWHREEAAKELTSASITWPSHYPISMPITTNFLTIELVSLTVPRKIEASMGNIIRQLKEGSAPIPASRDLEESVTEYFQAQKMPPRPLSVWALVSPAQSSKVCHKEAAQRFIRDNWTRNFPCTSSSIKSSLTKGARLHRVLSGGGGWGKKAGLLSLDPRDGRSPASHAESEEFKGTPFEQEGLTEIAKPNDVIQFFVPLEKPPLDKQYEKFRPRGTSLQRLSIGVIPSTIDQQLPFTKRSPQESAQFLVSNGECKILTESALDLRFENGNSSPKSVHASRLDVPYAALTYDAYKDSIRLIEFIKSLLPAQDTTSKSSRLGPSTQRRFLSRYSIASQNSSSGLESELRIPTRDRSPMPMYGYPIKPSVHEQIVSQDEQNSIHTQNSSELPTRNLHLTTLRQSSSAKIRQRAVQAQPSTEKRRISRNTTQSQPRSAQLYPLSQRPHDQQNQQNFRLRRVKVSETRANLQKGSGVPPDSRQLGEHQNHPSLRGGQVDYPHVRQRATNEMPPKLEKRLATRASTRRLQQGLRPASNSWRLRKHQSGPTSVSIRKYESTPTSWRLLKYKSAQTAWRLLKYQVSSEPAQTDWSEDQQSRPPKVYEEVVRAHSKPCIGQPKTTKTSTHQRENLRNYTRLLRKISLPQNFRVRRIVLSRTPTGQQGNLGEVSCTRQLRKTLLPRGFRVRRIVGSRTRTGWQKNLEKVPRRVEFGDEIDVDAAWEFFDKRAQERGQQEEPIPFYATRIVDWSKNRREGPTARAGLGDADVGPSVEKGETGPAH